MITWIACVPLLVSGTEEFDLLATIPPTHEIVEGSLRCSEYRSTVAYVARQGDKFFPVVGDEIGDDYDEVTPPVISPDGEDVYFRVMERDRKGDEEWRLLKNGKTIAKDGWVGPIALSPEGVPAYWTYKHRVFKGKVVLNFGRKKSKQYQTGNLYAPPLITADGKEAWSYGTRGGEWSLASLSSKGKELSETVERLQDVRVSPDGSELLMTVFTKESEYASDHMPRGFYIERRSESGSVRLGESYRSAGSPVLSADGKHVAYEVLGKDGVGVAIGDQTGAPTPYVFIDELIFHPKRPVVAFAACTEGRVQIPKSFGIKNVTGCEVLVGPWAEGSDDTDSWVVVAGDTVSSPYAAVHAPAWSPSGDAIAYAAKTDDGWKLVAGTTEGEPVDEVFELTWYDEGMVAFSCRVGSELQWRELAVD